jgi:hypothetical protein
LVTGALARRAEKYKTGVNRRLNLWFTPVLRYDFIMRKE